MTAKLPFLAAAASGPVMLDVLGYNLPVLAAILSVLGVVGASLFAPPPSRPLALWQRIALTIVLCILMLALVISNPERSIILQTSFGVGFGYVGLPIIEEIKRRILARAPELARDPIDSSPQIPDNGDPGNG